MNSFLILAVSLFTLVVSAKERSPVSIDDLSLYSSDAGFGLLRDVHFPHPRDVGGIVECGAVGEIVDVTFTDCDAVPCETLVGGVYAVQVKFRPSASHPSMRLQLLLIHDGTSEEVVDTEVPNSSVEEGTQYAFGYSMRITGAFTGPATIAFRLFGGNTMEICFVVGINVLEPLQP